MKYTKYKAFIFRNSVLRGSGQECNKCTSLGRYIYIEVGTGKKVRIYRLINESVSVRSRENSVGVLPRLRAGIPGFISRMEKIPFLSKKSKLTLGPPYSLFNGCCGSFQETEFQDNRSLAGDENEWRYTSHPQRAHGIVLNKNRDVPVLFFTFALLVKLNLHTLSPAKTV